MPIDLFELRKDQGGDPEFWRENQRKRFADPGLVDQVLELDATCRTLETQLRDMRKDFNAANKAVGLKKRKKEDASAEIAEAMRLKTELPARAAELEALKVERTAVLGKIANRVDPSVPIFKDEEHNEEVAVWGEPRVESGLRHHHELLWMIGGYEPERAAKLAGHRAYFLTGPGVELNLALINYGTQFLMSRAEPYTPVQPPFFVNPEVMAGVAQLSEFDEALYSVHGASDEGKKYLIATSEQPLCGYHQNDVLSDKVLPKRYAGVSTCFRKEAGSHGRDAWGIFRVHQFEKVEQFVVTAPSESAAMQKEMMGTAEAFYQSLGLPYRVVNMVSGELNNAAAKKMDLEAWFPALGLYRELVSCSNCLDYQARAMNITYAGKGTTESRREFCHLLNATLCATTRTICCILENYQTCEGITVPPVLVPFMGGKTFVPFVRKAPVNKTKERMEKAAAKKAGKGGKPAAGGAGAGDKGGKTKGKADKAGAGAGAGAGARAPAPAPKPAAAAAPAPAATGAPKPMASIGDAGTFKAVGATPAPLASLAPGGAPHRREIGSASRPRVVAPPPAPAASGATVSLEELDSRLLHTSFVAGFAPSGADTAAIAHHGHDALVACTLPNARRWYAHMQSFTREERAAWA